MDNIPTLVLRGHLSLLMQVIDTINNAVYIVLMDKKLIRQLLEHIFSVIDDIVARESIKLHDRVCQFSTPRNNSRSKDLEAVIFHHQSKLRAVPGKALDHFPLFLS